MAGERRHIVVLDWSGGRLAAILTDPSGAMADRAVLDASLATSAHEERVEEVTAGWRDRLGPLLIIAPGMIGSRNGWIEMPYVPVPATAADFAAAARLMTSAAGDDVLLLPGLSCRHGTPYPDVMRGEEVQILGADLDDTRRVVLPGGHTKWAETDGAAIARFQTFVTGELIGAMRAGAASLKPASLSGSRDWEAFDAGLSVGRSPEGAGLLSRMFCARTAWLAGAVGDAALGDYFTGIVVSAELEEAHTLGWLSEGETIGVIGDSEEIETYSRALLSYGATPVPAHPDAALRGALRISSTMFE